MVAPTRPRDKGRRRAQGPFDGLRDRLGLFGVRSPGVHPDAQACTMHFTLTRGRLARVAVAGALLATTGLLAPAAQAAPTAPAVLSPLATYDTGLGEGGAEIVAFDKQSQRLFVVNAAAGTVDVVSLADAAHPVKVASLATPGANSVAVSQRGLVAIAEQNDTKHLPGTVSFFDAATLAKLNTVTVGALPDMVTFSPDGRYAVVANEGEPEGYLPGQVDAEGSVSVIDVRRGAAKATAATASFTRFNDQRDALVAAGVRISGPNATVAQDLEPEYVAIDQASHTAYVTLQENNAIATIDLASASVTAVKPLGLKDHVLPGNGLDATNDDKVIDIRNWPVKGLYMPDGIAAFKTGGATYTITANEGDAREYDGWTDETEVRKVTLDPTAFPDAAALQNRKTGIGNLKIVKDSPKGENGYTDLWAYGARSVTIRDAAGAVVWDSGDALERLVAEFDPKTFNENHDGKGKLDDRSDNKGPEPEGVTVGQVGSRTLAFVGLERTSGIAVFDVTDPRAVVTLGYYENAGDFGPEGLAFVSASASPTGQPLLLVGNEISGTTTVWQVNA